MVLDLCAERELRRLVLEVEQCLSLELVRAVHDAADVAGARPWCQWAAWTWDQLHAARGCCA